jgi:hypothetical protein
MFDELRQDASQGFEDPSLDFEAQEAPRAKSKRILGMTAPQRFVIAVMLLLWSCTVSAFLLLATNKLAF